MRVVSRLNIALVSLIALFGASTASRATEPHRCFLVNGGWVWKAFNARAVYLRVGSADFYRLELANNCPDVQQPGAHLIAKFRGSASVCSALDWDLSVADGAHGIPIPCIVKTMTALSPNDVARIPRSLRP
jgi:hypothetical protein